MYYLFIRSLLEQSCVVWHSSLTKENSLAIERVQKCAVFLILQDQNKSYRSALVALQMPTCFERREMLNLSFAQGCLKNNKMSDLFPLNERQYMPTRNQEKYVVYPAKTQRLASSSVIHMQHLLNQHQKTQ